MTEVEKTRRELQRHLEFLGAEQANGDALEAEATYKKACGRLWGLRCSNETFVPLLYGYSKETDPEERLAALEKKVAELEATLQRFQNQGQQNSGS